MTVRPSHPAPLRSALPAPMLDAIRQAYRTPPRVYHSWEHVEAVLQRYDEVARGPGWDHPDEVFLAICLHDAVYVAGATDNESASAQLAVTLIHAHLPHARLDTRRIVELILLTARHGALTPADVEPEAALFLDCDLAILGAAPEAFDAYGAAIRAEYAHLPEADYAAGRRRFLSRLLASERIFLSAYFRAALEAAARANLQRALGAS